MNGIYLCLIAACLFKFAATWSVPRTRKRNLQEQGIGVYTFGSGEYLRTIS